MSSSSEYEHFKERMWLLHELLRMKDVFCVCEEIVTEYGVQLVQDSNSVMHCESDKMRHAYVFGQWIYLNVLSTLPTFPPN